MKPKSAHTFKVRSFLPVAPNTAIIFLLVMLLNSQYSSNTFLRTATAAEMQFLLSVRILSLSDYHTHHGLCPSLVKTFVITT